MASNNITYNIGLKYLNPNQMQKEFTINDNIATIDNIIGGALFKFVKSKAEVLATIVSNGGVSKNLFIIDANTTEEEWVENNYFDYILLIPFGTDGGNQNDYRYIKPRSGFMVVDIDPTTGSDTEHGLRIYHENTETSGSTNWKRVKLDYNV